MRLTLRTLLAYLDDTLDAAKSREIGKKLADSPEAQDLADRIKRVVRKRSLGTPPTDATLVTAYLSDTLSPDSVALFEQQCLESDAHLAEVAAVHQILTLLLCEQARVPPSANRRMYSLVSGRESVPDRRPGNTIPVGGARDTDGLADDADDAAYLLGMSGTRSGAQGQYAVKSVIGVLLALLAGTAAILAWPGRREAVPEVAAAAPAVKVAPEQPAPVEPPKDTAPPEVATEPKAEAAEPPAAKVEPPAAKVEPPAPEQPAVPPPAATEVAQADPPAPPKDDAPPPAPAAEQVPPSAERAPLGALEPKPNAVVARLSGGELARVPGSGGKVYSTEPLIALPGYKGVALLDGGVRIDLWGNLPELLPTPLPLFESKVTPYVPPAGLAADVAVNAGRAYLSATKPGGAAVRVRAADRVWDVKLADKGAQLAVEAAHSLTPASDPVPTRARGGMYLMAGKATVTPVNPPGEAREVPTGGAIYFDGRAPGSNFVPPNPKDGSAAYWNAFVTPADAKRAELTILALNDFAAKLTDPARVRETFSGGLPTEGRPTPQSAAAARVALFALAAVGDVPKLTGALIDTERPLVRSTAAEGLRAAAANDPKALKVFADTLQSIGDKPEAAREAVALLRGIPPGDQGSAAAAQKVVDQLKSASLAVRELAYGLLRGAIDPDSPDAPTLYGYDPGAPEAERAAAVAAWEKWAKGLGKAGDKPGEKK